MANVSTVPVVNMLSDHSHPLQALADALTMIQHVGELCDLTVAWVGDYNNVARSLSEIVLISGGRMQLGCPVGYGASDSELKRLKALGGSIDAVKQCPRCSEQCPSRAYGYVDLNGSRTRVNRTAQDIC